MNKILALLGFDPTKHSVKVELMAGLTTFLTMSYILAVNPQVLGETGMDRGALLSATIISAAIATLVMAFYAKLPFALASGMGPNAFFAYTLVLVMGYTWQEALAAVFVEGVVFILLTIFKVREAIINAIPPCLRYSIAVGIGLFIAFLGLKNAGIIVASEGTIVGMGPWTVSSLMAAAGVLVGGILLAQGIRGALFYAILLVTVAGIPFGVTALPQDLVFVSMPHSMAPIAFHLDFSHFLTLDLNYYIVVFTLLFMDLLDTLGTLIGTCTGAGMVNPKTGEVEGLNRALLADAVGTTAGALCGTSTVTTYVESTTGVAVGGRTGLTSLTVALFFLSALFFSPLFLCIPSVATASALVLVGVIMISSITKINFSEFSDALPCFITMVTMPFTGSISEGIVLGILSFVVVKGCTGHHKEISIVMYILAAFFVLKYIVN